MKNNSKIYGGLLAFGGALLLSTKAIIVKLAYQHDVDSASLLMLRMLFSLPFFIAIGYWSARRNPGQLKALRRPWSLIFAGLMGYYLAGYFDLTGLQYIDAGLERIVLFTYPTIVLLLSFFLLKEKILWQQVAAIVITFSGIGLAYKGNVSIKESADTAKGVALIFMAATAYSFYWVGSQHVMKKISSRLYNSLSMIVASAAIIIHNSLVNGWNLFDFTAPVYWYALLMSTISTVIPSFMLVEGIRVIGAKNSSIIATVGPITTIILASIFLGEKVNSTQWLGTLVVLGGVLFLMLGKRRGK